MGFNILLTFVSPFSTRKICSRFFPLLASLVTSAKAMPLKEKVYSRVYICLVENRLNIRNIGHVHELIVCILVNLHKLQLCTVGFRIVLIV
jgi:hypothetical protein